MFKFLNGSSVVTIANFSPKRNYSMPAHINIDFFRNSDSNSLSKKISLKPYQEFRLTMTDELRKFLQNDDGWITIKADNPFIQGFYFNFHTSGSVAGDHFF